MTNTGHLKKHKNILGVAMCLLPPVGNMSYYKRCNNLILEK